MLILAPYEKFLINLIYNISILLILILFLFLIFYFIKGRKIKELDFTVRKRRKRIYKKIEKAGYKESLGKKVVDWMIEISKSDNKSLIENRISKIIVECERLNNLNLPEEKKKVISTVLLWAKNFKTDRHLYEIKNYKESSQIVYDKNKNDFKLLITKE